MLFSGAPDADALAAAAEAEIPEAVSDRVAPVAVMLRAVVAVTVWFAIVSARPTPTAAVDPPATTAPAVEDALAFWVAVPVNDTGQAETAAERPDAGGRRDVREGHRDGRGDVDLAAARPHLRLGDRGIPGGRAEARRCARR